MKDDVKTPYLRAVSTYIDLLKSLDPPTVDASVAQLYLYRIGVDPYTLTQSMDRNPVSSSAFILDKKYLNRHMTALEHFTNTCIIYNIETHIKTLIKHILRYMDERKNDGQILDPQDRTRFTQNHRSGGKDHLSRRRVQNPATISPTTQRYMQEVIEAYAIDPIDNGLFTRITSRDHKYGTVYGRVGEIAQMTKADSYARHQEDDIPFDTILQYLKIFTDDKNNPTRYASPKQDYGLPWSYQQNLFILETVFFIVCMLYNVSASQLFLNDHFEQTEDANLDISDTPIAIMPSVGKSVLRAFQNTDGHRMTHLSIMYIKYMRHAYNDATFIGTQEPKAYDLTS